MKKKALIRLDSGGKFGLGHVMRSKALADALFKMQINCTFAVQSIHSEDAVIPHQLMKIQSEDDFVSLAKSYDVIIIDHYDYTTELLYKLSKQERSVLVVLDDECNRGHLYADIVINPVKNASSLPYKEMAPDAKFLFGPEYVLLRALFKDMDCQPFSPSFFKQRKSIVITFGGSDVTGLTLPVLKLIHNTSLVNFEVIVVTGAGCKNSNEIAQYCQKKHFTYQHNVKNMAALFSKARFAISAAGSTAFELAYCGVPSVFAVVADNQLHSVKEQCQYGWCQMVDCREQSRNSKNAIELLSLAEQLLNSGQLEKLSQTAQTVIDGKGAQRIAACIKHEISKRKMSDC